ncbi:MAG: DUF4442 domain-containing protein [Bdellovibrionaceae bacterium]|nr:DUF4442 domain-containing protein [Pseudobdellovibrionaceae bacterium]
MDNLWKENLFLRLYTLLKIPALAFITPKIVESSSQRSVVRVPLGYRTKNHLNVMYFGCLSMGAELCIGVVGMQAIRKSGKRIDLLFKHFSAEFLRRAEGDVHFVCEEVQDIQKFVLAAAQSTDRSEKAFSGYAVVPEKGPEPVMRFSLVMSVKCRS